MINFSILPLSFMLQLAAAALGLFMPMFTLLRKAILSIFFFLRPMPLRAASGPSGLARGAKLKGCWGRLK